MARFCSWSAIEPPVSPYLTEMEDGGRKENSTHALLAYKQPIAAGPGPSAAAQ